MATNQPFLDSVSGKASPISQVESDFDWQNCWYPLSFVRDLDRRNPTSVSLYDIPLVLFYDGAGNLCCLRDKCPHRAARLSDGQVLNGRLECGYHGWQFDGDGRCVTIPQLPSRIEIPERACVRKYPVEERQGMVWVWAGDPKIADTRLIPSTPDMDRDEVTSVDFQMDLPYDQSYLIENVIDVAHIHIAHHGVRGGGHRTAAKPIKFNILKNSIDGICSELASLDSAEDSGNSILQQAIVEYVAPNLIRYTSKYRNSELISGLDLYSLPLGKSRCRLLYRKYSNFTSWKESWKPRWLEHWTQCKILEQDMAVVVGQYEQIERASDGLRDLWFPIKTSDKLVIEYRKWLDKFGKNLPFYRGFSTAKDSARDPLVEKPKSDRYTLHTRVCQTCSSAYRNLRNLTKGLWISAAVLGGASIIVEGRTLTTVFVSLALLCMLTVLALEPARSRFEKNQYE